MPRCDTVIFMIISSRLITTFAATLLLAWATITTAAEATSTIGTMPAIAQWDLASLERIRERLRAGDNRLIPARDRLVREAEKALSGALVAVTDKPREAWAPTGDPHDYVSLSTYYWPDPADPKAPWIKKDGVGNTDGIAQFDQPRMRRMCSRVVDCALAAWFTGEARFAAGATAQVRRWFLEPDTRMNPHLQFAQFIPNTDGKGRASGLIDTRTFVELVGALTLLESLGEFTADERTALRTWFTTYLTWFRSSDQGKAESRASNNHATFHDLQVIAVATYLGDGETARVVLENYKAARIATQIMPDGSTPKEQARPIAATYTCFNFLAMCQVMAMGQRYHIDLWNWSSPDDRSLRAAANWLTKYTQGVPWTYGNASDAFKPAYAAESFWLIAAVTGDGASRDLALAHLHDPAHRRNLLTPLLNEQP